MIGIGSLPSGETGTESALEGFLARQLQENSFMISDLRNDRTFGTNEVQQCQIQKIIISCWFFDALSQAKVIAEFLQIFSNLNIGI